jgi:hypothetical protein
MMRFEKSDTEIPIEFASVRDFNMAANAVSFTLDWFRDRNRAVLIEEEGSQALIDLELLNDGFNYEQGILDMDESPTAPAFQPSVYVEDQGMAGLLDLCLLVAYTHHPSPDVRSEIAAGRLT